MRSLFQEMIQTKEQHIKMLEGRLAALYHARLDSQTVPPANPTTSAAVG